MGAVLLCDHGAPCWQEWKGCMQSAERTEERERVGREKSEEERLRGGERWVECFWVF